MPVPVYGRASYVATVNVDHRWFSMSTAIFKWMGWGEVAGSGLHYIDPASRLAPTNFGIGVLGLN
jgi:hypothetical protein